MWLFAVWGWYRNLHVSWIPPIDAGYVSKCLRGWFIGVRSGKVAQHKEHSSPLVHILEVVEWSLTKQLGAIQTRLYFVAAEGGVERTM